MRLAVVLFLTVVYAGAPPADGGSTQGSIAGVVSDAGTGRPVGDGVRVILEPVRKFVMTDANGAFEFKELQPGAYGLHAVGRGVTSSPKFVSIAAGQHLRGIYLAIESPGVVTGRVTDENGDPLPHVEVALLARDYVKGAVSYIISQSVETNDEGQYKLNLRPGYNYLLYSRKRMGSLAAISTAPSNPKLRKKVFEPVYYGGSDRPEGAQVLTLKSGEHRDGVDFRLRRVQSWCLDAVSEGTNGPEQASFFIVETNPRPGFSRSTESGVSPGDAWGSTGDDGKIRICDLHPGEYELNVITFDKSKVPSYARATVAVSDRDIHNVKLTPCPRIPILGEIFWDETGPARLAREEVNIYIEPLWRMPWEGEYVLHRAKTYVPGQFSLSGVLSDQYDVRVFNVPKDSYVKVATYAGVSVLTDALVPGRGVDSTLRIVLGQDGGSLHATIVNKDGQQVPDTCVLIWSEAVSSPAALAGAIVKGFSDQNGSYNSGVLAPGKYFAIATSSPVDLSADALDKLWSTRGKAQQVEITPNKMTSITIESIALDN